jgi:hypothetical protein
MVESKQFCWQCWHRVFFVIDMRHICVSINIVRKRLVANLTDIQIVYGANMNRGHTRGKPYEIVLNFVPEGR